MASLYESFSIQDVSTKGPLTLKASTDREQVSSERVGAIIRTMSLYRGLSDKMRDRLQVLSECPLYKPLL